MAVFETERERGRLTLRRPGARWLSNGFSGGYRAADAAHNLTVPKGFERTDLAAYAEERLIGLPVGPTLLTGVEQRHARGARLDQVEVVATAGVSNPAALPMAPDSYNRTGDGYNRADDGWRPGTVNLFVGTPRALDDGAMAGLLATVVEAKAATLLDAAGVPGTTSDAVVVGCDPSGEPAAFAGSATDVGGAARACVREAVRASLRSRYDDGPPTFDKAKYGLSTGRQASVFEP